MFLNIKVLRYALSLCIFHVQKRLYFHFFCLLVWFLGLGGEGAVVVLGFFVCFCCWPHLFDLLLDKTAGRDRSKIWPTASIQPFCTEERRFTNKFHQCLPACFLVGDMFD